MGIETVMNYASIVCGFVSAGFWISSACLKTPEFHGHKLWNADELSDLGDALSKQSRRSAWAAVFAAFAVALQALLIFVGHSSAERLTSGLERVLAVQDSLERAGVEFTNGDPPGVRLNA